MAEYCSKMTEHISKITELYIKMAYSKHKMTKYRGDGGLDATARGIGGLVNVGLAHRSMRDESKLRAGAWVGGERAGARVSGARTGAGSEVRARSVAHEVGWIGLLVGWSR
jgi:hypothetical protein